MSYEDQRQILVDLAEGRLSPDQAEDLLRRVRPEPAPAGHVRRIPAPGEPDPPAAPRPPEPPAAATPPTPGADAPSVRAQLSSPDLIEVAGDEPTEQASVDGPASVQVAATPERTVITGDLGDDSVVLVPPDADLDVEINSPRAHLHGLSGTLQAVLNVGDAQIEARMHRGSSRIEANCGHLDLALAADSDVTVAQRCAGQLTVDGLERTGRGVWKLGAGTALVTITGTPGSINVRRVEA